MEIEDALKRVIKTSWFTVDPNVYVYTKVKDVLDWSKHLIITQDEDDITVVTNEKNLSELGWFERNPDNWILLNIKCGNPFYCVGFLTAISSAFTQNGIDITMTSAYTRDYIMVQEENEEKAIQLLVDLGFKQIQS